MTSFLQGAVKRSADDSTQGQDPKRVKSTTQVNTLFFIAMPLFIFIVCGGNSM